MDNRRYTQKISPDGPIACSCKQWDEVCVCASDQIIIILAKCHRFSD